MKNYLLLLVVLGFIAFSCSEEPIGQQPIDKVPPGAISDVKVDNTAGGAILTYILPSDEDLLYVKAVYSLKAGINSEARSSMYTDTLKIAGFGDTQERVVTLIAVDRSRNESAPVAVTIKPLEAPVLTIGKSMDLVSDFGGIHAYWSNPTRAEVSVVILMEDNNKEYVPITTIYSSMVVGEGTQRGMDTIPVKVGMYIQDRWENKSEVKYYTLKPLFEKEFDRLKFAKVTLPDDPVPYSSSYLVPKIWDGNFTTGFISMKGTGIWPQSIAFDLGVTGKVSRIIQWQRQGSFLYSNANMRKFEVYGCETLDPSGNWGSWTKLMDCESIKPSGLPLGQNSDEDVAKGAAGEEYMNSPQNPRVRYLRIKCTESWTNGDFFHIFELKVFGDDRN